MPLTSSPTSRQRPPPRRTSTTATLPGIGLMDSLSRCTLQYPHPLIRLQPQVEDPPLEKDQWIADVVTRERARLRNFIRRRVPDPRDAEDILQDVFYELVEANRLLMPIEHVTGWLFRVARNRITDLFRKKRPERFSEHAPVLEA